MINTIMHHLNYKERLFMKKKGFTLIELMVSIVLVGIIMVSMIGTLLRLKDVYTSISENTEARTYSALVSKVLNEHFMKNNGIKKITCTSDTSCDIVLGNNKNMKLEISNFVVSQNTHTGADSNVATDINELSTLKYYGEGFSYFKTLKYMKRTYIGSNDIEKGYKFLKIDSSQKEYSSVQSSSLKDIFTTINIELNDPKYNVMLYSSSLVSSDTYLAMHTLSYDNNGGSGCLSKTVYDNIWGSLCTPTKAGFTFFGWFTQPNGGDQITENSEANKDLRVYAHWTKGLDLILTKETYVDIPFDNKWTLNNSNIDSNGILNLSQNDSFALSDYIFVAGEFWYMTFDGYTSSTCTNFAPNGGALWETSYYDINKNPSLSLDNYTANGYASPLHINRWMENIYWQNLESWESLKRYGPNVQYITIKFHTGGNWSLPIVKIKNLKVYGQMPNSFYLINVNPSNDAFVIKYDKGNYDVNYFKNNGTETVDKIIRVTQNGTYSVYVKDFYNNEIVKQIQITNIN